MTNDDGRKPEGAPERSPKCMVRPCVARGFRRSVGSSVLHQCIRPLIGAVLRAAMDISARAFSLAGRPQVGHLGDQCSQAPGRPSSISFYPLADLGEENGTMSSFSPDPLQFLCLSHEPFLRSLIAATNASAFFLPLDHFFCSTAPQAFFRPDRDFGRRRAQRLSRSAVGSAIEAALRRFPAAP